MDSAKLNDRVQIVGIFALVASLLFVGYQIKQTRDIAISQAFQARAESTANGFFDMAGNETFVSAIVKEQQGRSQELTPEELAARGLVLFGGMYLWENSYYQSRLGYIGQDHWTRTRAFMKNSLVKGPVLDIARNQAQFMRPEFREELEILIAEVESERNAQ